MKYTLVKYKIDTSPERVITIYHEDRVITVECNNKNYTSIYNILASTKGYLSDNQVEDIFETKKIRKYLKNLEYLGFTYNKNTRSFSTNTGLTCFNKEIVSYIIGEVKKPKADYLRIANIIRFGIKLNNQTSNNIKVNLFKFLLSNSIGFDSYGNVLAYKVVRKDYLDKHTRTIDNSVGSVVEMPRNLVDDRDYETCSHGLHVCALSYVSSFIDSGDRIVTVAIAPEDFVAVPKDYNFAKARVSRYEVMEDITNKLNINEDCNYFEKDYDDED